MKSRASIIIVTYNSEETLPETLDSIMEQSIPDEAYEVLVVDGGSDDSTTMVADQYPVEVYRSDGATIGECRNVGIKNASGRYVAFTDSDCRVPPDWLESHLELLEDSGPDVASVGGPNLPFPSDSTFSKVVGEMQKTYLGSGGSAQSYGLSAIRSDVESTPACNTVYKAEVFRKEKFDSEVNVGEDADLNYRLRRRGYRLMFNPNNPVDHHLSSSLSEFVEKNFSYGRAMAELQLKRKGMIRWYSFLPPLLIMTTAVSFLINDRRYNVELILKQATVGFVAFSSSVAKVYKSGMGVYSTFVYLLLPLQYLSYGIGFLAAIAQRHDR